MKQIVRYVLFFLSAALLAGCSTSRPIPAQIYSEAYQRTTPHPVDWQSIQSQLSTANKKLDDGQPEDALWTYQQLLHDYRSEKGNFELGLLTNASIACLEIGDREGFLDYAAQLESTSERHYQLPLNTQIVLVLKDKFLGKKVDRGRKVRTGLVTAVDSAFTVVN